MPSAQCFLDQVAALGVNDMTIRASSEAEAKEGLRKCRALQKDLRQIKKGISLEMKQIRAEYQSKVANAGSGIATAFSLFGKRKVAGSIRADSKRAMRDERDRVLAPYDNVKGRIDNVIHQLDSVKLQLEQRVAETKAEREASKPAPRTSKPKASPKGDQFCTQCGAGVGSSDRFCRECGSKLD